MKISSIFNNKPVVVAELSGNHENSRKKIKALIHQAKTCNVDAIKIQTFHASRVTINSSRKNFIIQKGLWKGKKLFDLYKKSQISLNLIETVFKECHDNNIICFSSVSDPEDVDFLEDLNNPIYKIGSFENNYVQLLEKVAETGKPVIMSTGLASLSEISYAVDTLKKNGCESLMLLKCTSNYPSDSKFSNILTIPHMEKIFKCEIGISDHTIGIGSAVAAISHGATLIEKHFTLSKNDDGVDSSFSMNPKEMKLLVDTVRQASISLGKVFYGPSENEKDSLFFRRSIYIVDDMKKGDIFDKTNIDIIRPGNGIEPKEYQSFLGKSINCDVRRGTPLSWDHLKPD